MIAQPTRTVSIGTTPTNIRKAPAFPGDPTALPVTFSSLRYPSGGGLIEMISGSPFAQGKLTFVSNPLDTETIAINGVTFTFVTGASTATNVHIGATAAETAWNLANVLNASANGSITVATYNADNYSAVVNIVYDTAGTTGNGFTLANSSGSVAVTRSASTLLGGQAYGNGQPVDAGVDFNDASQSLTRYAVASTGTVDLLVTDYIA